MTPGPICADFDMTLAQRVVDRTYRPSMVLTELFTEEASDTTIVAQASRPTQVKSTFRRGACLRAIEADGSYQAIQTALDLAALDDAASKVVLLPKNSFKIDTPLSQRSVTGIPRVLYEVTEYVITHWRKWAETATDAIRLPGVTRYAVVVRGSVRWTTLTSSNGLASQQLVTRGIIGISCFIPRHDGKGEAHAFQLTAYSCGSAERSDKHNDAGPPWAAHHIPELALSVAAQALDMAQASPTPSGIMPVIIASGAGSAFIHEICGHLFEADNVASGISPLAKCLGQRVADDSITIVDDPTLEAAYGSFQFDDEGVPTRRTVLIDQGQCAGFLGDLITARHVEGAALGHARRGPHRYLPSPRMSNTFVLPGNISFIDMVAEVGNGLIVRQLGSGRVDPHSGHFQLEIVAANLIQGGTVAQLVTGGVITGNALEVLRQIKVAGTDLELCPGRCEKKGSVVEIMGGGPALFLPRVHIMPTGQLGFATRRPMP